jgi:MFS family permease
MPDRSGRGAQHRLTRVVRIVRSAMRSRASWSAVVVMLCFRTTELATWVALLVWAFNEGGTTATGTIALAQLIPAAIVAPVGSVVGDRWTHRRALIVSLLLQCAGCIVTWIALGSGASFPVVCVSAGFLAAALALTRPAYYAALPELTDSPEELTALNSVSTAVEGFSDFLGPAIAGLLLATVGAEWVLLSMAGVTAVGALACVTLPAVRVIEAGESGSYLALLHSGLLTLVKDRSAALLTLLVGVSFAVIGMLDILAVVLALEVLNSGAGAPGLLTSAVGVGGIIGAAMSVLLIGRKRLAPAILIGAMIAGLPLVAASASSVLWEALVLFAAAGAGTAFLAVATRTLTQRVIAPQILTRVFGLQEAMLLAGTAIGAAAATAMVNVLGPTTAFVVGGLFLPLAALAIWPWIRRLDHRADAPGAVFDLLRQVGIFAAVPQSNLELLARELEELEVPVGEAVVTQGDPGDRYYLIQSGQARVLVDGDEVRALGPGDGFGEIALMRRVPRTATVQATSPLTLQALDRRTFISVVTGSPLARDEVERVADHHLNGRSEGEANARG